MDNKRLKQLAGIINEAANPSDTWSKFNRVAEELITMLSKVHIEAGGPDVRGPDTLNHLQVNDIERTVKLIMEQLDRLDRHHQYRDVVKVRRANMGSNH